MTHRHGRHGWQGFGPWMFAPPWAGKGGWGPGPGPHWGGPGGRGYGRRARRGDIRAAILLILGEGQPKNGYQLIQEIEERSRGGWKPSPGSIYPTLAQLEDEGLVRASEQSGRRVFELTDEGHAYVGDQASEVSAPFEAFVPDDEDDELRPLLAQTAAALWQVMGTGTPEQQERAREVLADTRRKLYGILADGDDDRG